MGASSSFISCAEWYKSHENIQLPNGLNFTGIDFPTPVSQIGRLERQNPNLAINVYMDSFERFSETQLPEKEKFYSSLSGQGITDEDYAQGKQVWETFGCRNLGDYHNLYVATDLLLLADVWFENFRKVCQEKYGLDPAHYYSAPGLSWDALLKKTGVELELLTNMDMHLMIERGMRGGISMVSKRYAKVNNPLVENMTQLNQRATLPILMLTTSTNGR